MEVTSRFLCRMRVVRSRRTSAIALVISGDFLALILTLRIGMLVPLSGCFGWLAGRSLRPKYQLGHLYPLEIGPEVRHVVLTIDQQDLGRGDRQRPDQKAIIVDAEIERIRGAVDPRPGILAVGLRAEQKEV